MAAEMKIGAYVCKGCGLGERLDSAQLAQIAQKEGKAQVVREHEFLCNADGVATIRKDIDGDGVNHVVIAACSRRSKAEAFNFEDVAVARATWSSPPARAVPRPRRLISRMSPWRAPICARA